MESCRINYIKFFNTNISLFVLGTYSIFRLNIYIAIAAFIIGFISIFIPIIFQKEVGRRKREYPNSLSAFTTKIKDIFSGFEVIKSFNIEDKIREDFYNSNNIVSVNIFLFLKNSMGGEK